MTTITLPRRLLYPIATRPARRAMVIGFSGALVAAAVMLAVLSAGLGLSWSNTVLPGVTVGGVSLAGLDRSEATQRLEARLPTLSGAFATLVAGERSERVAFADIGRRWDHDRMLADALGVGRTGNPLADGITRLRALLRPTPLAAVIHGYDVDALERVSSDIAAALSTEPVDSSVGYAGSAFEASVARPGAMVEADAVASALRAASELAESSDVELRLGARVVPPSVTTSAGRDLASFANAMASDLELSIPGAADDAEPMVLTGETIASWISFGPTQEAGYGILLDEKAANGALAALAADVDRDPVNARITVATGGGLGGVVAGQDGRALDVERSAAGLLTTLLERGKGTEHASMPLVVQVTQPAVTTARAEALVPMMKRISFWTTEYVPGEGNFWGNNINIPVRAIDGRNLYPGEWFRFWDSIGPVTEERGYGYGGAIIDGRSTQGVAIGGGICSASTTIFNAALRAGLQMGERTQHSYYIPRYPDGLDATVMIRDDSVTDMTFRNDTDNPIVLRGFGGDGFVTVEVWSVPLDRTVVITDPVTSNHRQAIETYRTNPDLPPGTSTRIEYPHDGHDVVRTRFVYDGAGNLIDRRDYFSSYRTINGITEVAP